MVSAASSRSETRSSESPARAPRMPNTRASTGPAVTAETQMRAGTAVCTSLDMSILIGSILCEGHRDLGAEAARAGTHLDPAGERGDERQTEAEPCGSGEDAHAATLVAHGDEQVLVDGHRLDLQLRGNRLGRVGV